MSMTFTKLFSSITESTVWMHSAETRIVWITMLAMADRLGNVYASVPGLAHRARVPVEACRAALITLSEPDPDSRSKEHEGRRIRAFDGGWYLLNHAKYRAVQNEEAVRQSKREHMQRKRDEWKRESTVDIPPLYLGSESGSPEGEVEGVERVEPRRSKFAPKDFEPTEFHRVRCQELQIDIANEVRDFKLHEFNRPYSDWDRRFGKWIEDSRVKRDTERAKANATSQQPRGGGFSKGSPPLEPTPAQRAYAVKHALELAPLLAELAHAGVVEALGSKGASEELTKRLTAAARNRAALEKRACSET